MKVDLVVVFLAHVRRIEALIPQWIRSHKTSLDSLIELGEELGGGTDADLLLPVFRAPNGQRCAPETAAAQTPVLDILKPLSEATGTGRLRFPVDSLVESHHLILDSGGLDEPGVERII